MSTKFGTADFPFVISEAQTTGYFLLPLQGGGW
jgi:hypothetical protein